MASYEVVERGRFWMVLHDGKADNEYATKEAAFEAAVGAASVAIREGHEVHISIFGPSRSGTQNICVER